MRKILIFILIVSFTSNCGYTPMYKNLKNLNFSVEIKNSSGDRDINNKIKNKLNSYEIKDIDKVYLIDFKTDYKKNIVSKDSTGAATEYKIILECIFIISNSEFNKELKYVETFNMQSFTDKLDEKDYEQSIQNSLTNIIVRKLILQLSQIK